MAKAKTVFFCKECGAQSSTWIGKCPHCGAWNSYVEEIIERGNHEELLKQRGRYYDLCTGAFELEQNLFYMIYNKEYEIWV